MADDLSTAPETPLVLEHVEFWMIWTKRGKVPWRAHDTYASAEAECERLARFCPGKKFIILEAISKRHIPEAPAFERIGDVANRVVAGLETAP